MKAGPLMESAISEIFKPVQKESTREKVCDAVRRAILSGRLKTGRRLTEIPLAQEFQVSRAVVREALQQLAHEGFIQLNAFKGAQVVALTPEEVDEIVHLRLILEPEAIRLAMLRMTEADKEQLKREAAEVDSARTSMQEFAHLDLEFHRKLWSLSGSGVLERHLTLLAAPLFVTGRIMRERLSPGMLPRPATHVPLTEVICHGNPQEAMEAIRAHITANWERSREAVKQFREADEAGRKHRPGSVTR